MKIEGTNYWLGKMGSKFFIWNDKEQKTLNAKSRQEAIKEAKQYGNNNKK
ncbi:hypothetical protein [Riemerella columbina]|nr:hypothetical protein [Riemerella columbina]